LWLDFTFWSIEMSVINTNVASLNAQNALKTNERSMSTTMQQLSTGSRINRAQDDAAGLAIGQNMTAQTRGLDMAVRNLNDGVNMLQTAEGAMVEQTNMLQRMRELAVQSSSGTYSNTQRNYLQTEFSALSTQIDKIGSETTWNGMNVLAATTGGGTTVTGSYTFQSGKDSGQNITVAIGAMVLSGLALTAGAVSVSSAASASSTIATIDAALDTVNSQRATIGAVINRLTYAADNVANVSANTKASRSTIMDTDYATASTQLSKNQIVQQAATAMLAQANQQPQSVLSLLK